MKSDENQGLTQLGSQSVGLLSVILLFVSRSVIATFITWVGLREFADQEVLIGQQNLSSLENEPWQQRASLQSGEFFTAIDRGPNALVQGFLVSVSTLFSEAFMALTVLVVLLVMEPVVAVTALLYFSGVALLQHRFLSVASSEAGGVVHDQGNRVYDLIGDGFHLAKLLTVMPSKSFASHLAEARTDLAKARAKRAFLNALPRYFMEAVFAMGFLATAAAVYFINGESAVIASLSVFAAAGFRLLPAVNRIQGLILSLYGDSSLAESALAIKVTNKQPIDSSTKIDFLSPFLALRDVSFRFQDTSPYVLKNISISFEKGKTYAVVGPSGSGKTTLVDICLGLLAPSEGSLSWSTTPIIGYVPQDSVLSTMGIPENISLEWSSNAVDHIRVDDSAKATHFVELLQRENGEGGTPQLSGGQKQRLGLARALYRQPNFLVLDEATSALDSVLENEVMQSLENLAEDVTVLIVAHRLTTIQDVDEVIYLEDGVISGRGTFNELRASHSKFAQQILMGTID
jgi:ABC-type multidrug transport system fused ATPase/permease subunit